MNNIFVKNNNIERSSFIWNMISSIIMAFQSVILLIILTHTVGLYSSGLFTIAYANANLFLTIGKYGVRNYQVSDVKEVYSFEEYKINRWLTTLVMICISIGYVYIIGGKREYPIEKSIIIILMCLFKAVDAIEDVYHGRLQQKGRLDIAGRLLGYRLIITIILFAIILLVFQNLLGALIVCTVFTTLFCAFSLKSVYQNIFSKSEIQIKKENVVKIAISCFPLFVASFLAMYIGNAPKYAIDAMLTDDLQAVYGFIAMPVFVIGLLNNFIFNPILNEISIDWSQKRYSVFGKKIVRQIFIIGIITLVCICGAALVGTPVLSVLYNCDLSSYKKELLILLVGGGFLGLSGFFSVIITIIRYQQHLVIGYAVVSMMAYFMSPIFVMKSAILGAAMLYMILMSLLAIFFGVIMLVGINKKSKMMDGNTIR